MLAIVVSRADSASVHIGEQLLSLESWETTEDGRRPDADGGGTVYRTDEATLREFDGRHLDLTRPADAFEEPTLVVFASKHAGETGALLTAHHTGNFGPADHGGDRNDLARACPNALARVMTALETHAPEGYDVGLECTHHGPSTVGAPSMFVEVGSAEPQWNDPEAARAVARAILALRGVDPDRTPENGGDESRRHLVGFGGGHYVPRFERVVRETDWALGHIAADWGLDALGDPIHAVVGEAFEQSRAAYALVDGDRPAVEDAVADHGYRPVGETWVRETDGVSLPFVRAVEERVMTVDDGLRFGERATGFDGEFVVEELPAALLDEARGIDREATYAAMMETTLAFGTDQGGTRVTGPVVLDRHTTREQVVERLRDVLSARYDSVERDGETVIAREQVFDPEKARTLGVPEGPKFGKLSNGQAVDVGGRRIPPEKVRVTREKEFPVE